MRASQSRPCLRSNLRSNLRLVTLLWALSALALAATATAQVARQTDWSGGPGETGPVPDPGDRFDTSSDIAWLSFPGRVALAGDIVPNPVESVVSDDAGLSRQVSSGDLDGDGRDELVSVDPTTDPFNPVGAIWWWDRASDGTWIQHAVSNTFWGAEHTGTADIDGDGDLDVIVAAYYGVADPPPPGGESRNGRYAWFENLAGDASAWQEHVVGELYWGANWIAAGDLDGDGDLDLAGASELTDGVFEQEADLVWFENEDGEGDSWTAHTVADFFPNASEVHLVDMDGDEDLDLLGTHSAQIGSSTNSWWENETGDASILIQHEIPGSFSGSGHVDAGDLDGDGDIDLMGGGLLGSELLVWENLDGQADSWTVWLVGVLVNGRVLELVDVDGDGDLDALTASGLSLGSGSATWYENVDGGGLLWTLRPIVSFLDSNPWIAAADVDADGMLDAVVADENISFPKDRAILTYDLVAPRAGGELVSSVLDGGDTPPWAIAGWDASGPVDGSLGVEVRASDDPADLGAWIGVPASGTDLSTLIDPASRYLQYRLTLAAGAQASPILRSIDFDALALLPPDPGVAGVDNVLTARWARPGEIVTFVAGKGSGTRELPGCPGVTVGVGNPVVLGSAVVDAAGEASVTFRIPGGAEGRALRFQAVGRALCVASPPLEVVIQ